MGFGFGEVKGQLITLVNVVSIVYLSNQGRN
jgi:hypothetical protein